MVKPQAIVSLWPMATPGSAGSPLPITFQPGAFRWTRYRSDGSAIARCGSLASSGLPDAERSPDTTQLLLSVFAGCERQRLGRRLVAGEDAAVDGLQVVVGQIGGVLACRIDRGEPAGLLDADRGDQPRRAISLRKFCDM